MKWAWQSGYFMGAAQVGAGVAGPHTDILINELDPCIDALDRAPSSLSEANVPRNNLLDIRARAAAGAPLAPLGLEIKQIWMDFEVVLRPQQERIHGIYLAGVTLGYAFMWCSSRTPTHDTITNLDQTAYWLKIVADTGLSLGVDYHSRIESIKTSVRDGLTEPNHNGLVLAANDIDTFFTDIDGPLPGPPYSCRRAPRSPAVRYRGILWFEHQQRFAPCARAPAK